MGFGPLVNHNIPLIEFAIWASVDLHELYLEGLPILWRRKSRSCYDQKLKKTEDVDQKKKKVEDEQQLQESPPTPRGDPLLHLPESGSIDNLIE